MLSKPNQVKAYLCQKSGKLSGGGTQQNKTTEEKLLQSKWKWNKVYSILIIAPTYTKESTNAELNALGRELKCTFQVENILCNPNMRLTKAVKAELITAVLIPGISANIPDSVSKQSQNSQN